MKSLLPFFELQNLKLLINNAHAIFANDELRFILCKNRYKTRQIKIYNKIKYSLKNTLSHNLTAFENLKIDFEMQRSKRLIFAMLADESLNCKSKILIVGPRSENELIFLKALGFKNIFGLDLISYSDLITLGDMHKIPFRKNTFDSVVCGWTLSYSKNPQLAIQEFSRILKPNGCIAIGVEHSSSNKKNIYNRDARLINVSESLKRRINSKKDILGLFPKGKIKYVNYVYDAELKNLSPDKIYKITGLHSSQVMVILKINK